MNTPQMTTEVIEWTVPAWMLCDLINGDNTGLTDTEDQATAYVEREAANISEGRRAAHWHWSVPEDSESYFSHANDADLLAGDVVDIEQVLMFDADTAKTPEPALDDDARAWCRGYADNVEGRGYNSNCLGGENMQSYAKGWCAADVDQCSEGA